MAVYTKTGDKGQTSTFGGKRISKSSKLISTIGAVDELNSYLGIVGGLVEIQRNLFTINAILTGAKLAFPADAVQIMETQIDEIEGKLPVQKNFIIYGGTDRAVKLFFARALCRKAERKLVDLKAKNHLIVYLNRLSDFLFILARKENLLRGKSETFWKGS